MTRFRLDAGTRRVDGDAVLIGGSPLRILRLSGTGARLLDQIERGEEVRADQGSAGLERLLDAGVIHPIVDPEAGRARRHEITVVVPVHDAPDALAATLAALAITAVGVAGVIVVDDASPLASAGSQRTAVDAAGAQLHNTRVVTRAINGGPAAARNSGLDAVDSAFVAFIDAGCAPEPGWLDVLVAHFADPHVAAVAPRIVARPGAHDITARTAVRRYEASRSSLDLRDQPGPVKPRSRISYVPATTLVVRAAVLRELGGFDETLRVGEDVDLVWRLHERGQAVRYEPDAQVGHDHPDRLVPWFAKRVAYGSSAAPLAKRHPGALAPVDVSGWGAAAWALVALGHPVLGAAIVAGTTAALAPKLAALDHPVAESIRLAGRGHLAAGRLLASAAVRAWWPVAVPAAVSSRRLRRSLLFAAAVPHLAAWLRDRRALDPVRFTLLGVVDDLAYGTGVWLGCARHRTAEPLRPRFRNWPGRADAVNGPTDRDRRGSRRPRRAPGAAGG